MQQDKALPDKVVGLDQVRIARGLGKICQCQKRKFVLDTDNRRVTCRSCGAVVEPYEAILDLARQREEYVRQTERLLEQRKEIASYKPHLVVIKSLEQQYRGKKMLPCCPRCNEPFYLEELVRWQGRQFADGRIKRYKEKQVKEE